MKLTIESTTKTVELNGVPARISAPIPLCPRGHEKTGHAQGRPFASGEVRLHPMCLICRRKRKRDYESRNPGKVKEQNRVTKLKINYGVSPEEYNSLLEAQSGRCAVCGTEPGQRPLGVDHKGPIIRGLLCDRCNLAAGLLRDDPAIARRFADYFDGTIFTRLAPRAKFYEVHK